MKATRTQVRQANKIACRYCKGYIKAEEIQTMYDELSYIGITTGMICNSNTSCEWYINGEEVENSVYVYSIYKNEYNSKIEFTIYFS